MREYEYIYVLKPELSDAEAKDFMLNMKSLIVGIRGRSIKISCWGRRWLAWARKGSKQGIFVCHHFLGEPEVVSEYGNALQLNSNVLLKQCVLLKKNVDVNSYHEQLDMVSVPRIREEVMDDSIDFLEN